MQWIYVSKNLYHATIISTGKAHSLSWRLELRHSPCSGQAVLWCWAGCHRPRSCPALSRVPCDAINANQRSFETKKSARSAPDLLRQSSRVDAADADDPVVLQPRVERLGAVPVRRRLAVLVHYQARRPYLLRLEVPEICPQSERSHVITS